MRITLFFILIITSSLNSKAQTEQKFFVGVNLGTKFGNKNYATRYSGVFNDALFQRINLPETYNAVRMTLEDNDFLLPFDSYPLNIRYIPRLLTGLQVGYNIGPNLQVNLEANVAKLEIKEVFTIQVLDAGSTVSEAQIRQGNIYGEESRFTGRVNMDYITSNDKLNYIAGLSGVFSAWRMDEHFAELNGVRIPLFTQFNVSNNVNNGITDVGFGLGINLGLEYRINEKITGQFMYQPYAARLDYGYTIAKRLLLEHDVVVRILWK